MRLFKGVVGTVIAACLWGLGPSVLGQPFQTQQHLEKHSKVSERELQAFARAYVDYHRIRRAYEPALEDAKDNAARIKIQDEGNAKVKEALAKQHLSVEEYNRVFRLVNQDEELRRKAMKIIEYERKNG